MTGYGALSVISTPPQGRTATVEHALGSFSMVRSRTRPGHDLAASVYLTSCWRWTQGSNWFRRTLLGRKYNMWLHSVDMAAWNVLSRLIEFTDSVVLILWILHCCMNNFPQLVLLHFFFFQLRELKATNVWNIEIVYGELGNRLCKTFYMLYTHTHVVWDIFSSIHFQRSLLIL